jgi:hypothetical protein
MFDDVFKDESQPTAFFAPEYSDWECQLFGTGENGIVYRPLKGKEPNWFWRWMQYLLFGNRWIKKASK